MFEAVLLSASCKWKVSAQEFAVKTVWSSSAIKVAGDKDA